MLKCSNRIFFSCLFFLSVFLSFCSFIPSYDPFLLLVFLICEVSCLFNPERMTSSSFSISIGFAMCPSMPASKAFLYISITVNTVPFPGWLSTSILPPIRSTYFLRLPFPDLSLYNWNVQNCLPVQMKEILLYYLFEHSTIKKHCQTDSAYPFMQLATILQAL